MNVSSSEGLPSLFNRVIQEKLYCFLYIISGVANEKWQHISLDFMSALRSTENLCFVYHPRVAKRFAILAVRICGMTGRAVPPSRKSIKKAVCLMEVVF